MGLGWTTILTVGILTAATATAGSAILFLTKLLLDKHHTQVERTIIRKETRRVRRELKKIEVEAKEVLSESADTPDEVSVTSDSTVCVRRSETEELLKGFEDRLERLRLNWSVGGGFDQKRVDLVESERLRLLRLVRDRRLS